MTLQMEHSFGQAQFVKIWSIRNTEILKNYLFWDIFLEFSPESPPLSLFPWLIILFFKGLLQYVPFCLRHNDWVFILIKNFEFCLSFSACSFAVYFCWLVDPDYNSQYFFRDFEILKIELVKGSSKYADIWP